MEDWPKAQGARASALLGSRNKMDVYLGSDVESKANIAPIYDDLEILGRWLLSLPGEKWAAIHSPVESFLDMVSELVRKMAREGITREELPLEIIRHLHNQFQHFIKLLEAWNFSALASFQVTKFDQVLIIFLFSRKILTMFCSTQPELDLKLLFDIFQKKVIIVRVFILARH